MQRVRQSCKAKATVSSKYFEYVAKKDIFGGDQSVHNWQCSVFFCSPVYEWLSIILQNVFACFFLQFNGSVYQFIFDNDNDEDDGQSESKRPSTN